jgi:hypothetical protein
MSEVTIVEIRRQSVGIIVPQSLVATIITTGVQIVVTPNMDVIRRGVLIGFATKLGSGLNGILAGWKQNGNATLPTITIGIFGKP